MKQFDDALASAAGVRGKDADLSTQSFSPFGLIADTRFVLAASGHVAGVINPPARHKRSHWLNDELGSDPEAWFDNAQQQQGSWWPDWDAWMKHHSSGTIPAPTQQGNAQYHPIEPAPGRYVKQKSN